MTFENYDRQVTPAVGQGQCRPQQSSLLPSISGGNRCPSRLSAASFPAEVSLAFPAQQRYTGATAAKVTTVTRPTTEATHGYLTAGACALPTFPHLSYSAPDRDTTATFLRKKRICGKREQTGSTSVSNLQNKSTRWHHTYNKSIIHELIIYTH